MSRPASRAGVAQLKASLSEYLRRVRAGDEVIVTQHGEPIARLVPIARDEEGDDERRRRLIAEGVIAPRTREPDAEFLRALWAMPRPADPEGRLRAAIDEDREESY